MKLIQIQMEIKIPTMRNKNVGYGQGSTVESISDEFAEYALNLAATNIVLLVDVYKGKL